ncbi:CPCC family cysteine-rich protein [Streptomyces griseus]|uniref:CPCC family cysteine-rich protein n=1 Tax=Streptomyces griseus TaxID=1911 RepID=UPI00099BCFB7|nr:CPCC family cysteine-rich protein [Streptomyces griseus]
MRQRLPAGLVPYGKHPPPEEAGEDRAERPTTAGGANKVSLTEAQRNYQDFGACDEHGRRYVRPPTEDEPLAPAWRLIDPTRAPSEDRAPWPDDPSVLCRWLPTFWRRDHSTS